MTDDQFDKLVTLLTDIKKSINVLTANQTETQLDLKNIYRIGESIDLSIQNLDISKDKY